MFEIQTTPKWFGQSQCQYRSSTKLLNTSMTISNLPNLNKLLNTSMTISNLPNFNSYAPVVKVMEKKATLAESVSVQEQYEKLLADYADFLDTADDKLKTEQISARDLDHLKEQLATHKVPAGLTHEYV